MDGANRLNQCGINVHTLRFQAAKPTQAVSLIFSEPGEKPAKSPHQPGNPARGGNPQGLKLYKESRLEMTELSLSWFFACLPFSRYPYPTTWLQPSQTLSVCYRLRRWLLVESHFQAKPDLVALSFDNCYVPKAARVYISLGLLLGGSDDFHSTDWKWAVSDPGADRWSPLLGSSQSGVTRFFCACVSHCSYSS